jgi:hypothetical protein
MSLVRGERGEQELNALIDTGASYTVLPTELVEEVGAIRTPYTVDLELGDGRTVKASVYVASSESGERERGKKFEYEAGGVREYWLIDPDRQQAEFYRLMEGRYRLVYPDSEGLYRSEVLPGFWLEVEWLWQEPLPPILEILGKLRLV